MRISPHKHRVCAVPFPRPPVKFVRLSLSCYAMRTLPLKHLCNVIHCSDTLLLQFVYAYAYALMRNLPHKHRVCECFSLGLPFLKRLYSNVCRILLRVFSLIIIGFVQCLSLGPLLRWLDSLKLAIFATNFQTILHLKTVFCLQQEVTGVLNFILPRAVVHS